MTTITYKDGIMAADSGLYDDDGHYYGQIDKIFRLRDGSLVGQSGDGDGRALIQLLDVYGPAATAEQIADTEVTGSALMATPDGKVYYIDAWASDEVKNKNSGSLVEVRHTHYAIGSGRKVAVGAMAAGKSAEDAIRDTIGENVFTRSPIQVFKLHD